MSASVLIAWALKHELLVAWGAVLAIALGAAGLIHHKDAVITRERGAASVQRAAAATKAAQAGLNAAVLQAADRAASRGAVLQHTAERAADAIQSSPGASAPVPPDVLRAWAAGVDGLRDTTGRSRTADAPASRQPASGLPAAG